MRIRYLILHAYGRGGTIRTTLSMASELADRGHDVEIASLVQRRPTPEFPVSPRVRLVSLTGLRPCPARLGGPGNAVRYAAKVGLIGTRSRLAHPHDSRCQNLTLAHDLWLRRYLAAQDDCVVVATRITLNVVLARLRTDRIVAVAQEHNHLSRNRAIRADYVAQYPALDALAVLTRGDADAYRALLGKDFPVIVMPNALAHGTTRRRSPLTEKVALAAGSLVKRKGFDLLIEAWRPIAVEHPDWRLRIYGGGALAAELAGQVAAADLTGIVTIEGFDPDLARRLDQASLFVLPSRGEGLPMVVIEAMAAGLPVVAADCPTGPAELLEGGRSGLLVPREDTAALTGAIRRVVSDEGERRRLADAAATRARDFDLPATADRWEEHFRRLGDARGLSLGD